MIDNMSLARRSTVQDSSASLILKHANLAVKLLVELAAFVAFAFWGSTVGSGGLAILAAIAVPATAVVLWGLFAAPQSRRRLTAETRVPFELAVFALASLALFVAGAVVAAITLGAVVIVNSALMTALHQWGE